MKTLNGCSFCLLDVIVYQNDDRAVIWQSSASPRSQLRRADQNTFHFKQQQPMEWRNQKCSVKYQFCISAQQSNR